MSSESKGFGEQIYDGSNELGKFIVDVRMIIALIIGLLMIVVGMYLLINNDDDQFIDVKGIVSNAYCKQTTTYYDGKPTVNNKCIITVTYKIDNVSYSKSIYTSDSNEYITGQPINLSVRKTDMNDVSIASFKKHTIAMFLFVGSIFVAGFAYFQYYLTHNYKPYAAAQGASTMVGLFRV